MPGTGAPMKICNVATGYFMKGEFEAAARWYRLALALDANLAIAYQNLAAIHSHAGRSGEAEACRERAYRIQRVFIECIGEPMRRVLILCVGRTSGNVPVETLLPGDTCCRIKYAIDYAAIEEDRQLPPFDLVFNAIGDPDVAAPLAGRLEHFLVRCDRPLLNRPSAVARTRRHLMAALLGDVADVLLAPCLSFECPPSSRAALHDALAATGVVFPVLARPAASHGGQELVRCASLEALHDRLRICSGTQYLSTFHDNRYADGCYRKYRIIFVDREPFPYHLAISRHWMVHYFSADMAKYPERMAEERRFLEDPGAILGARAMAAVAAIGRRLDLDYGGIDFTLLPDGRLLVFEANATMLVHRARDSGPLANKNVYVQRIVDAFERLQAKLSGRRGEESHSGSAPQL